MWLGGFQNKIGVRIFLDHTVQAVTRYIPEAFPATAKSPAGSIRADSTNRWRGHLLESKILLTVG